MCVNELFPNDLSVNRSLQARIGAEEYALGQSSDLDCSAANHLQMLTEEMKNMHFGEALRTEFVEIASEFRVSLPGKSSFSLSSLSLNDDFLQFFASISTVRFSGSWSLSVRRSFGKMYGFHTNTSLQPVSCHAARWMKRLKNLLGTLIAEMRRTMLSLRRSTLSLTSTRFTRTKMPSSVIFKVGHSLIIAPALYFDTTLSGMFNRERVMVLIDPQMHTYVPPLFVILACSNNA
jgi:hypothetical protein